MKFQKELKFTIYFVRLLFISLILSNFELPFIHLDNFFGGDYLTQLVVIIALHQIFTALKKIIEKLSKLENELSNTKNKSI